MELYVAERAPESAKAAAELADSWEVIHYGVTGRGGPARTIGEGGSPPAGPPGSSGPRAARAKKQSKQPHNRGVREWHSRSPQAEVRCFRCRKLGHLISSCPEKPRRDERDRVYLVATWGLQTQGTPGLAPGEKPGSGSPVEVTPPCSLLVSRGPSRRLRAARK